MCACVEEWLGRKESVVEEEPEPAHQAVRGPGHVARELPVQADPVRAPVYLIITQITDTSVQGLSLSMDNIQTFPFKKA